MLMNSTKLLAFPEALKDAEAAIKIDPTFIKAYIRKALVQQGMKDNTAAMETLQKATEADVNKQVSRFPPKYRKHTDIQHTRELESNMSKIMNEIQNERSTESDEQTYARAMRDPEVAEIMSDPVMYVPVSVMRQQANVSGDRFSRMLRETQKLFRTI
jgi:stress-induced-phosphoprotein 1